MDAEDFAFNNCSNSQVVKYIGAILPWVGISIFTNGLVVEAVHRCDLSCLVITAEKCDVTWPFQLEAKKQLECFNRVVATINKVAHKDIARIGNLSSFFEELEQVVELTMDVTANSDWGAHWLNVTLFDQYLLYFFAENTKITFGQNSSVFDGCKPRVDVGWL